MRKIKLSNRYLKDLKKVGKYKNFNSARFAEYCNKLANGESLPESAKDHKMSKSSPKEYKGTRNFHVAPDICVIYTLEDEYLNILRIGKHNDLNLTEMLV